MTAAAVVGACFGVQKSQYIYLDSKLFSDCSLSFNTQLGTIQVLRHQRGGWVGSENQYSKSSKKVKNVML